ncbi:multidrug resistance fnx1 [Pyrenophora seminiperda CCB06]|uniref:Multidrug resistance fnx1 n=1 Tax=Pyrenophora seminiperda CCB06 TaxID=1302712 RepID=A0A3M7MCM1_9PLEO|nr:multidrug resistance fnx1 [Pyrenophora seminiperda CCB06]
MKKETEEAVESAKGLLEDIVIVVSLVRTLTDSFGSVKDLYRKLKPKSIQKDSDSDDDKHRFRRPFHSRRDSGFSMRKKKEDEFSDSEEELICTSSVQVRAEYERGYRKLGEPFARGDTTTHIQLQTQIIQLQQTLLNIHQDLLLSTYMAPSSSHSHLLRLLQTTRKARAASIAALNMQYQRMLEPMPILSPLPPREDPTFNIPGSFPPPDNSRRKSEPFPPRRRMSSSSSCSSESREKEKGREKKVKIELPPKPTPKPTPPPLSHSTSLFCVYAKDLQQNATIPLADTYKAGNDNKCPFCRRNIDMQPGKAWEIITDECKVKESRYRKAVYRTFRVKNRFVVKSHREQGGFACVLCARYRKWDTVCRGVSLLMDHLWKEHSGDELGMDNDIIEC